MSTGLLQTPLHQWHATHGARLVDFSGWSMPVQYTSIVDEHRATRERATMFDISHMGRLRFEGGGVSRFLDRLTTRRVLDMKPGRIRYSLLCNDSGGILDDILVYAPTEQLRGTWTMVVNAGNRSKIVAWVEHHLSGVSEVQFSDRSSDTAMIAIQGPAAVEIAATLLADDVRQLKYFTGMDTCAGDIAVSVSRTGYTGEDGLELICEAERANILWEALMEAGATAGLQPAGLGARDTLRLESAMPLYGHELSESIDPFEAGLGFAVSIDHDRQFVGAEALRNAAASVPNRVRVGLELSGKRVPREHYPVLFDGSVIGEVTSGTYSPTLDRPLAMAYVAPNCSAEGTELAIDIRGRHEPATVVPLPFYRRA
jgi:aminomethyltransferase